LDQLSSNADEKSASLAEDGVIFESITIGNQVRISAIDTRAGVEVSLMGPAQADARLLQQHALQKLRYRLQKQGDA
jgi:transcription elongation GreA/GreB family factor